MNTSREFTMTEIMKAEAKQWRRVMHRSLLLCWIGLALNLFTLVISAYRLFFVDGSRVSAGIAATSHVIGVAAIVYALVRVRRWVQR